MVEINVEHPISKNKNKAEKYLKDKNKLTKLIDDATEKANKTTTGPVDKFIEDIKILIGLISDYVSGNYRQVPWGSLVMIVAAVIYFVSPFDFVPDTIPGVGYLDDITVVAYVIKQIDSDLEKYKQWKGLSIV